MLLHLVKGFEASIRHISGTPVIYTIKSRSEFRNVSVTGSWSKQVQSTHDTVAASLWPAAGSMQAGSSELTAR